MKSISVKSNLVLYKAERHSALYRLHSNFNQNTANVIRTENVIKTAIIIDLFAIVSSDRVNFNAFNRKIVRSISVEDELIIIVRTRNGHRIHEN